MEEKETKWLVITDEGIPYADSKLNLKKVWRGGSPSLVYVPIFYDRKSAIRWAVIVRRQLECRWTKTIRGGM